MLSSVASSVARSDGCCVCCGAAYAQESWCKKGAPTPDLISQYKPQPLPPPHPRAPQPAPDAAVLRPLVKLADQLGALLQNQHQVREEERVDALLEG